MKATVLYLTSVIAVAALSSLPWAYKSGFSAGVASITAEAPPDAHEPSHPETADLLPSTTEIEKADQAPAAAEPKQNPFAAAVSEIESPLPATLSSRIDSLTSDTPIEDALAIWAEINALPEGSRKKAQSFRFLKSFGESHGEEAFLATLDSDGPNALRNLGPIAAGWAKNAPDQAWAALLAASNNGAIRGVDLRSTIAEVSRNDLPAAVEMINDLQGGRRDYEFKNLAKSQKTAEGFETVLQSSLQIGDESARARSVLTLFDAWSNFDFDGSLNAIGTLSDSEIAKNSMHGILNSWAQRDGAEAFSYALENQTDPNVEGALLSITKNWLRSSSAFETTQIFDAISTLPNRDQALYDLTPDLIAANPHATMEMVDGIQDPETRNRTYAKAISYWGKNDIDGAEQFALTQEDQTSKAAMLSSLSRGRMERGGSLDVYAEAIADIDDQIERQRVLIGLRRNITNMGTRASEEQLAAVDSILERYSSDMENVTFMPDGRVRIRNSRNAPSSAKP